MTGNQYGCNICKRSFKSSTALQQHKADSHPQTRAAPSRSRGRGVRGTSRFRGRGRGRGGFSLNPTNVSPVSGGTITVSGEDRVLSFTVPTTASTMSQTIEVDAVMSPRLKSIAMAFQRIRFLAVTFNVTAQVSAMTNGGYIAGFIMDPDDASISKTTLQASQGSVIRKWFESANVIMPRTQTLFYTSSGQEPRLRAPARFWIMVDQAPSTTANVVITAHWRVVLSKPTFEELQDDYSFFLRCFQLTASQNNYNLQAGKAGTKTKDRSDDTSALYPEQVVVSSQRKIYFAVPTFNIEYHEGEGDTGTIQCHFIVYDTLDKKTYYSTDGVSILTTVWQGGVDEQIAVPAGTYIQHHRGCPGNEKASVVQPDLPSSSLLACQQDSRVLHELLNKVTNCLERLTTTSSPNLSRSSSVSIVELPKLD